MKLFQYAILWHPTDKQKEDKDMKSRVIKEVTTVLAKDAQGAALIAAREIPQENMKDLDQIEVAVRPF